MPEVLLEQKSTPVTIGATGLEALAQNIRTIILTAAWSVPLDRGFAHLNEIIDAPAPNETARYTALLIEAIEKYEPRVRVQKLEWVQPATTGLMEGRLIPKITFAVREGVEL